MLLIINLIVFVFVVQQYLLCSNIEDYEIWGFV